MRHIKIILLLLFLVVASANARDGGISTSIGFSGTSGGNVDISQKPRGAKGSNPGAKIAEKLLGDTSDTAGDAVKQLYERQVDYLRAQESQASDPDKVMQKQLSATFMGTLIMLMPLLSLAGMVLLIWAIKIMMIDDYQRHGGPAAAVMSGGFKAIVALILIGSPRIAALMNKEGFVADKVDVLGTVINIILMASVLCGMIVILFGVNYFYKVNQDRDFQVIRGLAMIAGGALLISLKPIIFILMGI